MAKAPTDAEAEKVANFKVRTEAPRLSLPKGGGAILHWREIRR